MSTIIQKWGNSLGVRIPKKIAEGNGLKAGSGVFVRELNGKIIIEPKHALLDLKKVMKKYTPATYHSEIEWGKPAGKEVW